MYAGEHNDDGRYNDLVPYSETLAEVSQQWMSLVETTMQTAADPEYAEIFQVYYDNAPEEKKAYINQLNEAMQQLLQ